MAKPQSLVWISADDEAIAKVQSAGAAARMLLNGTISVSNNPVIVMGDTIRDVTLTSAGDMSAVNFTIVGTSFGNQVQETIAGPNANTVVSANFYDSIISITSSAAFANVSAGTGFTGYTRPILHNFNASVFNLGVTVLTFPGAGAITYTYFVNMIHPLVDETIEQYAAISFAPFANMTASNASHINALTIPVYYSFVQISASSADAALNLTFIQQGLISG